MTGDLQQLEQNVAGESALLEAARSGGVIGNDKPFRFAAVDGVEGLVDLGPEVARASRRDLVERLVAAEIRRATLTDEIDAIIAELRAPDDAGWRPRHGRERTDTGEGIDRRRHQKSSGGFDTQ